MNSRLQALKERTRDRGYARFRTAQVPDVLTECEAEGLSWPRRAARLTRRMCEAEQPVIGQDERIVFTRTVPAVPSIYTDEAWAALTEGRTLHELGPISNISADWGMVLSQGLLGRKRVALATRRRLAGDPVAVEFCDAAIETIDAVLDLTARYAQAAQAMGRFDIVTLLAHVPANPPQGFHEALQALRILHAAVWMSGHYHVGLGRFDQYMWPYLRIDLETGRLDLEGAQELLAEFFIALNRDSDLYPGVQQGDNGQTLMLGGVRRDGSDGVNELTWLVLRTALDTSMIDPKINLRITPDTDLNLLSLASQLTRQGLGFPQYSNDEVVIPALATHGYDLEDARDYTVAACWEFIVPGKGMEVVNIGAVSMPAAADTAIRQGLREGDTFEGILARTSAQIKAQLAKLLDAYATLLLPPAPYYSVLMDGCLERGRDLSQGLRYNNFGVHGAHAVNAADALAAVRAFVFEDRSVAPTELVDALEADFEGYLALQQKLVAEGPKVGNNDADADALLVQLYDYFADACEAVDVEAYGRRVRPGTGSAMYYVWLARGHEGMREPSVGATADGRKAGEMFSANLAPSSLAQIRGPISVLQSFAKIDYSRVYNGGPITIELSDSVFSDDASIRKVALLVRMFAQLGGQQLQLNTLNVESLRDAQVHPERHKNLIVRVWGWSGYFCELEREYQDHVIARHIYQVG